MAIDTRARKERALLVGISRDGRRGARLPAAVSGGADQANAFSVASAPGDGLAELALLTQTAGGEVVGRLRQRRESLRPSTFLSSGKLEELKTLIASAEADVVVFDDDLSPIQARNLEKEIDRKIIDRTELILDIFARRARTHEAQLQVELAQLEYLLPRLTKMWAHLSRLGGGIGTRGPGETQLEVDRRRVRHRIALLKRRLEGIEREREVQQRRRREMYRASLVGYTNAGKSTLFNALTHAGVLEEDMLFATLDTTTRRLAFPGGDVMLLSDTVGFIRKLPHHLVASFRATLREVREADLLIHVVDAAQPEFPAQMAAVDEVLEELLDGRPVEQIVVLSKIDLLNETECAALRVQHPHAALLSARDPRLVEALRAKLLERVREDRESRGRPAAREESSGGDE
ncbi:MAG: GTPase HflX [Candidatus Eisenbacteria bacterium]|nr:GTPase HflX [Candidatus Eisenbacteria bacterium]